jgi:hypothetical protein
MENTINITKLESAMIHAIAINEMNSANGSVPQDAEDTLCDMFTIYKSFFDQIEFKDGTTISNPITKRNVAGIASSLTQKGLIKINQSQVWNPNFNNNSTIELSEEGFAVFQSL